ncbi:hypothetical protein G6F22_019697 [Rhizopus arrhizus]|nr:hypothetical protein G6F22_019697 [Rhizopus arrhizus]
MASGCRSVEHRGGRVRGVDLVGQVANAGRHVQVAVDPVGQRGVEHRVGRRPDRVGGVRVRAADMACGHAGVPIGHEGVVQPDVGEPAGRVGRHIAIA